MRFNGTDDGEEQFGGFSEPSGAPNGQTGTSSQARNPSPPVVSVQPGRQRVSTTTANAAAAGKGQSVTAAIASATGTPVTATAMLVATAGTTLRWTTAVLSGVATAFYYGDLVTDFLFTIDWVRVVWRRSSQAAFLKPGWLAWCHTPSCSRSLTSCPTRAWGGASSSQRHLYPAQPGRRRQSKRRRALYWRSEDG